MKSLRTAKAWITTTSSMLLVLTMGSVCLSFDDSDRVKEADFLHALQFYSEGGSFCFRLVPEKDEDADKQTEWTVPVLSSKNTNMLSLKLGEIRLGEGSSLSAIEAGLNI